MNVRLALEWACERTPTRTALVQGDLAWSYAQLWTSAVRLAQALSEMTRPGERVLIGLRNTPENVSIFIATQIAGLVYTPINYRLRPNSINYLWRYADVSLAVVEPDLYQTLMAEPGPWQDADASGKLWIGNASIWDRAGPGRSAASFPALDAQDLSMLLFTSGTTGSPKGIPLSNENVLARTIGPSLNWDCPHDNQERVMGLMPLYHTIGLQACLLYALIENHTFYPMAQFSPRAALDLIEAERISHLFATPTHLYALIKDTDASQADLSSLTNVLYGGAPMSPHVIKEVAELLCPRVTYVYGNTETYNALYHRQAPITLEQSVCGIYHRVRVVEIGGDPDQQVAVGQQGELIIDTRSPESFRGYWRLDDKTREKIRDGWYFTGDSCIYGGENLYHVTGRVDDMIISGAENIQPVTVENALLGHPDVLDAAVIGVSDDRWGQVVKAFLVTQSSELTPESLDEWVRTSSQLDPFARPRIYQFVPEIPRNPSGKILRQALMRGDQAQN